MATLLLGDIGREYVPIGRLRCPRGLRRAQVADSGRKWRHSQGEAGSCADTRGAWAPTTWPHIPSHSAHKGAYCCYGCASHWQFFVARCRGHCARTVQLCLMVPKQGAGTVSGLFGPSAMTPSQAMSQPSTASVALGWRVLPAGILHVA